MTEYEEKTAMCKRAEFVYTEQDSFGLYLEFSFDDYHGTSFYISSRAEVEEIRKMLNKDKTGMAQDSLSNKDLKPLIGKSVKILTSGIGTKCIYKGFLKEVTAK